MDTDKSGLPGGSGVKVVTRKYLLDLMQQQELPTFKQKLNYLENHLMSCEGYTETQMNDLKRRFSHFKSEMIQRWLKTGRKQEIFLKNNESWLNGTFEIPLLYSGRGRPSKSFEESSERSKRRKTEDIRASIDDEVMIYAAKLKLQTSGKRDASQILNEITSSPTRATKYKRAYSQKMQDQIVQVTPVQALSMFVEADLTRRQYEVIRSTNKKIYPCYSILQKTKQECYPPKATYRVTSTSAETNLQALTDHTVTRLCKYLKEVLITLNESEKKSLKLICKWGCDGSQQSQYKQKFENDADSDANLFLSSFVPLQVACGKDNKKIIWQNPTPSSPRFCRPIRFRFLKESTDITEEEIKYVKNAAESLAKTDIRIDDDQFTFEHIFIMTMVDGKVCNAATGTKSTSKCYVCGATSKDLNNLNLKNKVDDKALEFGLSVLHARIRFLESILHLAYKLPVRKYRKQKTASEKVTETERKGYIQERFRVETGLLLDRPKAGFGNTNDGNTSRRFFENPQLAADITGISYQLIFRLKVILEAISSGYEINIEKFEKYTYDTAKLYVELYSWHPMTPTMHKILMHGGIIIKNALVPIGQLSEEAAEARNKHFRSYRQNFARKFTRESCNLDIYNRLLLSSDPFLSSMRQTKTRKLKTFLPETIELLMSAEPNTSDPMESEDEDDSEEDF